MRKIYLVSEDEYSGQVVIICETEEVPQRIMTNPEQVMYLYDEPIYEDAGTATWYNVKAYYHYENGESDDNLLIEDGTYDKAKANSIFKSVVEYLKC